MNYDKMKKDKNGNNMMAIYCWNCSHNKHANMHKGTGKGYGKLIGTKYRNKAMCFRFRCTTCQFTSLWESENYVRSYGIR